jgi:threonine/homoserine/homoserine lactone efflux protein
MIGFLIVAVVVVIAPGPDFALTVRNSIARARGLLTLAWLAFVGRLGSALRVPAVRRVLDVVTGVVLVAFGVLLATERR